MNLTIGKKILAGFSAVIIATLLMSGYTYYKIGEMNREYHDVTTINLEKLALVEELSAHIIEEAATVRKYNLTGDLIAVENFIHGGKDGLQQYYNYLGDIEREENWKGFNPDSPYIFIPIYGTGSGEILEMKKVKAEPYSVKHGFWKYYEPGGRLLRTDEYLNNQLVIPKPKETTVSNDAPKKKEVPKTPEMIEWEKKNSGKKKALREGKTSL